MYTSAKREWVLRNQDRIKGYAAAYYQRNKAWIAEKARARALLARRNKKCRICGKSCKNLRFKYTCGPRHNREWERRYARNARWGYDLRLKYGLTEAGYGAMLAASGGRCYSCGDLGSVRAGRNKRLCVDHSHTTRVVRGLLCERCNVGIGMFLDSPARLRLAIQYLESGGKPNATTQTEAS